MISLYRLLVTGILVPYSLSKHIRDSSCTRDHLLCGSDGVTYLNICEFREAKEKAGHLEIEHRGLCKCTREEKTEWNPICGSDSDTYANYCEFQKAKTFNHYLTLQRHDVCEYLMKKEALSLREFQKLVKWKTFMPQDLYEELAKRPVYGL